MNPQELDDYIDLYLKGEMPATESAQLEAQFANDTNLRTKIEARKLTLEALRQLHNQELKQKLMRYEQKLTKSILVKRLWLSIAAGFVLVLLILGGYKYYTSNYNLLVQYDMYEEGIPNVMGIYDDVEFQKGMNAFKLEDYPTTIAVYKAMEKKGMLSDTLSYYLAVAYYREERLQPAVKRFEELAKDDKTIFKEKSMYRLAVLYMEQGQNEKALKILDLILVNPNHSFFDKAQELRAKIKDK